MVLQNRKGFESTDMITIQQLKFRSIVVQTGPFPAHAVQLKSLLNT